MSMPQRFQFEDWACWIMLSKHGSFVFLPEQLVLYRYHDAGATARLLRNRLEGLYSLLELQLALSVKSAAGIERLQWFVRALGTLQRLKRLYRKPPIQCENSMTCAVRARRVSLMRGRRRSRI
jgi:hypothetical protein